MGTDASHSDSVARIEDDYDLVVVGCGIAGLSAGIRAAELGRSVAILEKAPEERRGGQTQFTESFRVPSADTDLSEHGYEFDIPDYTTSDFYRDIMNQANWKADDDLVRTLVDTAGETIEWLTDVGVEWEMTPPGVGYTAARTWLDGEEMVSTLVAAAEDRGVDVFYETEARWLLSGPNRVVTGVETISGADDERVRFECPAVVLASGGYESSPEKRTRYYGGPYEEITVRGTRYNTGEGIDMAMDFGAQSAGQWSGAHMAIIDAASPPVEGGITRVDGYQYGVIINHDGERFVDEGQDSRAHTYARFGRRIFEQPYHEAFIVVDSKTHDHILALGPSDPVTADDLGTLFRRLDVGDPDTAVETVEAYNAACDPGEFDPTVLDGNAAPDVDPPKSNWALPIDEPPFYGYPVTGGITFAFGGVKANERAEVIDTRDRVIPGLYAAGNSVGGLFYDNYPGGTGLMNAAVYGKIAGEEASDYVEEPAD